MSSEASNPNSSLRSRKVFRKLGNQSKIFTKKDMQGHSPKPFSKLSQSKERLLIGNSHMLQLSQYEPNLGLYFQKTKKGGPLQIVDHGHVQILSSFHQLLKCQALEVDVDT